MTNRYTEPTFIEQDLVNGRIRFMAFPNEAANTEKKNSAHCILELHEDKKEAFCNISLDQFGGPDKYHEHITNPVKGQAIMNANPALYRALRSKAIREGRIKLAY